MNKLEAAQLGHNWQALSARDGLEAIGHDRQQPRKTFILSAPSVLESAKQNFLIDPLLPDYSKITIGELEPLETDFRLLHGLPARCSFAWLYLMALEMCLAAICFPKANYGSNI